MKMIDNKTNFLIDELNTHINKQTSIYIQCKTITFVSILKFIEQLKSYQKVEILVTDISTSIVNFTSENEDLKVRGELNILTKSIHFLNELENNITIKEGSSGVNAIYLENENSTKMFVFTQDKLDSFIYGFENASYPIMVIEQPQNLAEQYLNLFHNTFKIATTNQSVKELTKLNINESVPKTQYLYTLQRIFNDYDRIEQYEKIERTGFFNSKIWSLLYNFQKDAVLGTIDKIERYGGCIIADSVGLGKTFEALGVIKYYQDKNNRVLVLCPKRLYENWNVFLSWNNKSLLKEDRLNYQILFHTDLSREKGESNGIPLEDFNWENIDLIVIDESHNFRNNNPSTTRKTRYERLMEDVIKKGVKTKILMLSATPVNNKLKDLKNQLYFITEEDDHGFANFGITSINHVMRQTQRNFNDWLKKHDRNRNGLIDTIDSRYFKLLDMLTIARSRKHIEKYYDTKDIGQFPNRLAPKNLRTDIDTKDEFADIGTINQEILRMNMAQYKPTKYIKPEKRDDYSRKYDYHIKNGSVFRQESREESLVGLMRVNYLKRLESSIFSFTKTLKKLQEQVSDLIKQIDHFTQSESIETKLSILDDFDIDTIDPTVLIGNNVKVLLQDIDLIAFKDDLQFDLQIINKIVEDAEKITESRDEKLKELKKLIKDKVENPINANNKKILIFSAFADTATYLYDNIANWAKEELNLYSGLVTGSNNSKTNLEDSPNKFNDIILNFSPRSKKRPESDAIGEIDILIGTDCISEGQNLQDCDYLVNYDIHWNPVRIVQRFGRIDRIGSTNTDIQLANFWPNIDLNAYINLIDRVKGRMEILDVSATGDENIISTDVMNDELSYRVKQLEKLQTQVIDLEDLQGDSISITDFTFNDFKVDLDHLTPTDKENLQKIIPGFAGMAKSKFEDKGVVFCLKHTEHNEDYTANNPLYPFGLVFVSNDGEIIYNIKQSKNTLDVLRNSCMISPKENKELIDDLVKKISNKKEIQKLQDLYAVAIESIKGNADLNVLDSVFNTDETVTPIQSIDTAFSLINYFIIT